MKLLGVIWNVDDGKIVENLEVIDFLWGIMCLTSPWMHLSTKNQFKKQVLGQNWHFIRPHNPSVPGFGPYGLGLGLALAGLN